MLKCALFISMHGKKVWRQECITWEVVQLLIQSNSQLMFNFCLNLQERSSKKKKKMESEKEQTVSTPIKIWDKKLRRKWSLIKKNKLQKSVQWEEKELLMIRNVWPVDLEILITWYFTFILVFILCGFLCEENMI